MADNASNAMGKVGTFLSTNKTYIIAGIVAAIAVYFIYNMFFRQPDTFEGGYGAPYPGTEGFYNEGPHPAMMQQQHQRPQHGKPEMGDSKRKFVLFYAPWCGHCKKIVEDGGNDSVWERLVRKHGGRQDLSLEKIDCDEKPEIATQFGIGGFPTMMLFNGSKNVTYDGDRSFEDLDRYLTNPPL